MLHQLTEGKKRLKPECYGRGWGTGYRVRGRKPGQFRPFPVPCTLTMHLFHHHVSGHRDEKESSGGDERWGRFLGKRSPSPRRRVRSDWRLHGDLGAERRSGDRHRKRTWLLRGRRVQRSGRCQADCRPAGNSLLFHRYKKRIQGTGDRLFHPGIPGGKDSQSMHHVQLAHKIRLSPTESQGIRHRV